MERLIRACGRLVPRAATRTAVVGLIVVGALTFGLTSAWAPPNTKWYSTAITAPNPANVPAGAATPVTVRVTNCGTASPCTQNSTQSLGSANLTFPTNLSVPLGPINASNITQAQGKTWSADVVANPNGTRTVRLRNPGPNTTNALAPGQSVSVTVNVTASGTCGPQPPIATETKQSNDFSGNGNNFTRLGAEPTLAVSPGTFASFAWTAQPDASQTAGTAFTPAAGIKVEARDGCGAVVTNYTGANAVFSGLHDSPNGDAAELRVHLVERRRHEHHGDGLQGRDDEAHGQGRDDLCRQLVVHGRSREPEFPRVHHAA